MKPSRCHVADSGCLDPAGFGLAAGGSAENSAPASTTWRCPDCDEPTCVKCRGRFRGKVLCASCVHQHQREAKHLRENTVNARDIISGRKLLLKARAKIDEAIHATEGALSPMADKTLGVTRAEYRDRMLAEVDGTVQTAIDALHDAQHKLDTKLARRTT